MSLRPRGKHKPPVAVEIRTSLNVLKDSTHLLPYKSAVSAVLAVWDFADRVPAFDEQLAWRALHIMITIFDAGGGGAGPVSAAVLNAIVTFEDLLREISAAMEEELEPRWLRVLHMQKRESRLPPLVARLDVISEAFGSAATVEEQPVPATPDQSSVLSIPGVFGGTGGPGGAGGGKGGVGGAGGSGHGPTFQAGNNITINNYLPEHKGLEQSNIRRNTDMCDIYAKLRSLDNQVRFLRTVVLFGLSPVSRGYIPQRMCGCTIAHAL
ncbi:hypothetical protein K438DRAFT_1815486 [Mycena galopus ATCC 62051]|nr:hypothetical protein K438DRAFT_1815486 [Mycena galopus ATCC 62051]